ncbi:hypothetical protein MMC13_001357 [Lambiella insularis]|nr:hypothetical protein [Lambiella insularis]
MSLIALIRFVFGAGPAASSRQPHALLSPLLDQGTSASAPFYLSAIARQTQQCSALTALPDPESGCTDPSRTSSATHDSHCDGERSETDEKAEVLFPLLEHRRCDPRLISDATIGLSDGLTVPFALSAGLSALGNTKVVIFGGMAELIAGAISMGLGVYLGARSEA